MDIAILIERFIVDELIPKGRRARVDPDESLLTIGEIDSLALLQLIAFVEEQFGVSVEDDELTRDNFQTINRIKLLVEKKWQNGSRQQLPFSLG